MSCYNTTTRARNARRQHHVNPGLAKPAKKRPELFNKSVYNQAGLDIFSKLETL